MRIILSYILVLILAFSCSDTPDVPKADVYEIRNIGELATTEYTVGKIIKLDDEASEWYKYGDRKILISTKAKIKAGIDLTQIQDNDIQISGNKIIITLPPAKIISFSMDPKDIETEMESINGFRDKFTQQEKIAFLKQGEASIKKDIAETGIIKDANDNAILFLEDFYKNIGFDEVIVKPTIRQNEP